MFNLLSNAVNTLGPNEKLTHLTGFGQLGAMAANFFITVAFGLSLVGFAYAMIQFILSQGDKKALQNAQQAAMYSAIAFVVAFMLIAIKNVVMGTFVQDTNFTNDVPIF